MKTSDLVRRVDEIIELGTVARSNVRRSQSFGEYLESGPMQGFRSAALSFIQRVYTAQHSHFTEFANHTNGNYPRNADEGLAIIQVVRSEIAGGWLVDLKTLVAAELFADFLQMAEHLRVGLQGPSCHARGECPRGTSPATLRAEEYSS